jgi:DNA-directed RNA polymerase II subunit RPB2
MFLKERLLECSDMYSCHICKTCGLFATRQKNVDKTTVKEVYYCQNCDNNTATAKITIPYAFKLLIQELATLNIAARIHVK